MVVAINRGYDYFKKIICSPVVTFGTSILIRYCERQIALPREIIFMRLKLRFRSIEFFLKLARKKSMTTITISIESGVANLL